MIPGWTHHFGAGQTTGGSGRDIEEWILKPASNYILTLTSEAASNDCTLTENHYEHTDD